MRDTSLLSYYDLLPDLGFKQQAIFEAIRNNPGLTARELQKVMHYNDPNKVRPRINELYNLGLVYANDKKKCTVSNKTCYVWRVR